MKEEEEEAPVRRDRIENNEVAARVLALVGSSRYAVYNAAFLE